MGYLLYWALRLDILLFVVEWGACCIWLLAWEKFHPDNPPKLIEGTCIITGRPNMRDAFKNGRLVTRPICDKKTDRLLCDFLLWMHIGLVQSFITMDTGHTNHILVHARLMCHFCVHCHVTVTRVINPSQFYQTRTAPLPPQRPRSVSRPTWEDERKLRQPLKYSSMSTRWNWLYVLRYFWLWLYFSTPFFSYRVIVHYISTVPSSWRTICVSEAPRCAIGSIMICYSSAICKHEWTLFPSELKLFWLHAFHPVSLQTLFYCFIWY